MYSGYRNVADKATVTATNEIDGSAKYLTDGMTVTMRRDENRQFRAKGCKTKITLTFREPVSVRGILIYNSYNKYTFKNVSTINFALTETPAWHNGKEKSCFISDLPFAVEAYSLPEGGLQPGNGIVDFLLCYFCACIDSICTFQFRLVFCPKAFSAGVLSVEHISSGVILPAIGSGGSFDRLL